MTGLTDDLEMTEPAIKVRKPKPTTVGIPPLVLSELEKLKIVETETIYSVIERLIAEHDLKSMQKVVLKRIR